jgi:hypothetical protein
MKATKFAVRVPETCFDEKNVVFAFFSSQKHVFCFFPHKKKFFAFFSTQKKRFCFFDLFALDFFSFARFLVLLIVWSCGWLLMLFCFSVTLVLRGTSRKEVSSPFFLVLRVSCNMSISTTIPEAFVLPEPFAAILRMEQHARMAAEEQLRLRTAQLETAMADKRRLEDELRRIGELETLNKGLKEHVDRLEGEKDGLIKTVEAQNELILKLNKDVAELQKNLLAVKDQLAQQERIFARREAVRRVENFVLKCIGAKGFQSLGAFVSALNTPASGLHKTASDLATRAASAHSWAAHLVDIHPELSALKKPGDDLAHGSTAPDPLSFTNELTAIVAHLKPQLQFRNLPDVRIEEFTNLLMKRSTDVIASHSAPKK